MQDYDALEIATGDGRMGLELVPQFGGIANAFWQKTDTGTLDFIAGHRSRNDIEMDRYYRGVPLYPFANRLADGHYQLRGKRFQFALNEPARGNSLHGFLYQLRPRIEGLKSSEKEAEASLVWMYKGDVAAYPFPARIAMRYHLHSEIGLTLTCEITNLHGAAVPLSIGWHPYFMLGGKADEWELQLPPALRIAVDQRLLPTGEKVQDARFLRSAALGSIQLDDCFLVQSAEAIVASRLWSPVAQRGIELWQERQSYPYIQVFIPPDRRSIAIEPVSGGINCFNTGENLQLLPGGETFAARCGVRIMQGGQ